MEIECDEKQSLWIILIIVIGVISIIGYTFLQPIETEENPLSEIRIACYNGKGVMKEDLVILSNLVKWMGYEFQEVSGRAFRRGILSKYDVLILPGGNGQVYWNDLGKKGKEERARVFLYGVTFTIFSVIIIILYQNLVLP